MSRESCIRIFVRLTAMWQAAAASHRRCEFDPIPPLGSLSSACLFVCAALLLLLSLSLSELTLDRGEKLENMEEKAENLENHASMFQKNATKVKRHFCYRQNTHARRIAQPASERVDLCSGLHLIAPRLFCFRVFSLSTSSLCFRVREVDHSDLFDFGRDRPDHRTVHLGQPEEEG